MLKINKNILFIPALLLSFLLLSCDIKSPIEGIDVILNQKEISTTVAISFVDANTGTQIGATSSKELKIEFAGKDKNNIMTLKELPLDNAATTNGIIGFAIKNTRIPSKENPVEINVIVSADGYSTTSKCLLISKKGANPFKITMVNQSAPPQGSTVTSNQNVPASNGQISSTTTVTTGNENITGGCSSININSGTGVKDASGALITGTLQATISYFNNKTNNSLSSFPGGLIATATQNNSTKRGLFSSAGFAEFTIQNQSGKKVKTFTNPVELSIDIPAGTINKETNTAVKNGDVIPIWSYDESAASWKFEKTGIAAGPDSKGNFKVSFSTDHLSWWNLGWLGENVCTSGATINLNGNYASLTLVITNLNDGTFIASETVSSTENSVTVQNAPAGVPVKIEAFNNLECNNNLVGSVTANDLCGSDINLNINSQGTVVTVKVEAFCSNRDPVLRIRPSIDIYMLNSCGERIIVGKMDNGFVTLESLVIGNSYIFGVYYDDDDNPLTDNWHQSDPQLIDKSNYDFDYELDAEVCDDL